MRRWISLFVVLFISLGTLGATCPPSPNNSTLSAGTSAVLTDSLGQGWGIPKSGGMVFLQGTSLQVTSGATQLAYAGNVMWYKNASGWFSLTSTGQIASGPQVGPPTNGSETISVNTIATQTAATPFVVSGTIQNATSVPTLQYSVNGGAYLSLSSGAPPVSSPLSGTVTTGSWVVSQQLTSFANGPGGKPMQYGYLLPSGYDPVHFSYPLMFVGAGLGQGMNGSVYPRDGTAFIGGMESDNFKFNTVAFRTAHPAIIVAPQCDQTLDPSNAAVFNSNCGGYADAPNTSWAEQAISALEKHFANDVGACGGSGTCSIDPTKVYANGLSLSAIGYLAQMVDNNQINGLGPWTAGVGMSTQLFRPATPNANVFSRMRNVPYLSICSPGDNPCNYDLPFWQSITGNTNYPTQNQYNASGITATQAGTTADHLIGSYNGGTAYGQFGCMNADGCDGTAIYAWLFQQASSGSPSGANVTQTSYSFTVPGLAAGSANTISVRDANNTTAVGFSNTFAVNGTTGSLSGTPKSPLSSGYLHVSGNQILDGSGNNVRLSCSGYGSPTGNYASDMSIMRNQGFNCARYDLTGAQNCPGGTCNFSTLDQVVNAATANNMRVVFDMKANETGCGGAQPNGLWYDQNSTTPVSGVTWNALLANGDGCAASAGTGNFRVSGGYLIDPTGAKFIPEGTNIYDYNISQVIQTSTGFPLNQVFPKVNYLRILVCGGGGCSQNGSNGSSQPTSVNYPSISNYAQIASWCQSAKIVCEFEDHNSNGSFWEFSNLFETAGSRPPTGSLLTSMTTFWAAMATQFKGNPYAWIGSINELGVASYSTNDIAAMSTYELALYNAIRATGNKNVINLQAGADGPGTLGIHSGLSVAAYAGMTNIIFWQHYYLDGTASSVYNTIMGSTVFPVGGGSGCAGVICIQTMTSADGIVPVIINEFGSAANPDPNQTSGQAIASALAQAAINDGVGGGSFLYWDPNGSINFNQVNNAGTAGLPLSSYTKTTWGNIVENTLISPNPFPGGNGTGGGSTNQATVSYATFKSEWTQIAQHYSGNATVIAMDLWNEAQVNGTYQSPTVNWGNNNGADEKLMCSDTGAAVQAADPGVLVICEGPVNPSGPFFSGTAFQANFHNFMDLSVVATKPVTLAGDASSHVVYSVHDFPQFGQNPPWLDSGASKITMMNTAWGSLVVGGTAPVWLGAMGASLDGTDGFLSDEQAWATTLANYVNGLSGASGGPTFTGCQQPVGANWFTFGNLSGTIDGTMNSDGSNKAGQQAYWSTLLYTTCSQNNSGGGGGTTPPGGGGVGVGATTWNPGDLAGVALSTGNTVATATGPHQGVRSTTSQSTGKVCVEATASTISANWSFGIANSSFSLVGNGIGSDANAIGIDPNSTGGAQGIFFNNAALSTGSGTSPSGEKQTICVDLGTKLFWVTNATQRAASHPWNNSASATPATETGGISFAGLTCPCFATFTTDETPSVATLNAPGPFAVSTPTGFVAWQAPVTAGNHPIVLNLGN